MSIRIPRPDFDCRRRPPANRRIETNRDTSRFIVGDAIDLLMRARGAYFPQTGSFHTFQFQGLKPSKLASNCAFISIGHSSLAQRRSSGGDFNSSCNLYVNPTTPAH
jgi:hypothetical protein